MFSVILFLALIEPGVVSPAVDSVPRYIIHRIAGRGKCGFKGDGGPALLAKIQRPTAVAVDSKGNVYIADEANQRIRMVTPDLVISTFMGTGDTTPQDRDLPAIETNLDNAYGIATDHLDNVYVASRGHATLYRVGQDGIAQRIAGTGEPGFSGDGGPALEAQIYWTNHMVADRKGNLFLADTGNHRIRKISADGIITTIAGTGKKGFSGDGGPATKADIYNPVAIAIDDEGSLYIADFSNHRIRKITADGLIHTVAGSGQPKYNGEGLPALESNFGEPCGVAIGPEGRLFIADQINLRVRVVLHDGTMHTIAGTGKRGKKGDGGPAEKAQISNPDIIAFDPEGNLIISDHRNCLIRKLTPISK